MIEIQRLSSSRTICDLYLFLKCFTLKSSSHRSKKERIQSISSYLININWPHGKHRESHDHASQSILFHRAAVAVNEHKSNKFFRDPNLFVPLPVSSPLSPLRMTLKRCRGQNQPPFDLSFSRISQERTFNRRGRKRKIRLRSHNLSIKYM